METALLVVQPIRASEVRKSELELFVGQQIAKALLVAGYDISQDAKSVILEEVPKDIQTRFRVLELPEIKKAIEDGVRGVYGEYYGINTVTINKWLKSYVDGGNHQCYLESKIDLNQKQLAEKAPLTESEIDDIIRKGIVNCFNNYKNTGVVLDYGSPKINWLLAKGILCPDKEERDSFKEQARYELEQNAHLKKDSLNRIERNEAKKEIEELVTMLDSDPKIQSLAKNMCLKSWFENIIESGEDISELIK